MILYGYLILFLSVLYMLTVECVRKLNKNICRLERGNFCNICYFSIQVAVIGAQFYLSSDSA